LVPGTGGERRTAGDGGRATGDGGKANARETHPEGFGRLTVARRPSPVPGYFTFPGGSAYSSLAVARSASDNSFTRTFGVMMFAVSVV